jgi:ribulose 1,5-bisphosphate synthetase/thiazole synthase
MYADTALGKPFKVLSIDLKVVKYITLTNNLLNLISNLRDMTTEPIIIIGGGLAGLIAAIHLKK